MMSDSSIRLGRPACQADSTEHPKNMRLFSLPLSLLSVFDGKCGVNLAKSSQARVLKNGTLGTLSAVSAWLLHAALTKQVTQAVSPGLWQVQAQPDCFQGALLLAAQTGLPLLHERQEH